MTEVKKWIESRKRKPEAAYDKAKKDFEMALGKPFIEIKVELPEGFEDLRNQFLRLEEDEQFREEVRDLIKKRLTRERRR